MSLREGWVPGGSFIPKISSGPPSHLFAPGCSRQLSEIWWLNENLLLPIRRQMWAHLEYPENHRPPMAKKTKGRAAHQTAPHLCPVFPNVLMGSPRGGALMRTPHPACRWRIESRLWSPGSIYLLPSVREQAGWRTRWHHKIYKAYPVLGGLWEANSLWF